MKVTDFGELRTTVLASLAIDAAAGLATTDNAGWPQLLGLAVASQISLVPTWLGYSMVHGLTSAGLEPDHTQRLVAVPICLLCLTGSALAAYAAVRMRPSIVRRYLRAV